MQFAYRSYRVYPSPADPSTKVWRPELKVLVCGIGGEAQGLRLWGLLDTAAVECILPYEVADLVKPAMIPGKGIMADYTGEEHPVEYGRVHFQIKIEKRQLRWPAIVVFDPARKDSALWGRCGFLDYFRVTFDGPERHFTIRLRGPLPRDFLSYPIQRRGKLLSSKGTPLDPDDQDP